MSLVNIQKLYQWLIPEKSRYINIMLPFIKVGNNCILKCSKLIAQFIT